LQGITTACRQIVGVKPLAWPQRLISFACAPLASSSVTLAWRVAGASMYLHWLQELRAIPFAEFLAARPLALHVAGLGGLLLVVLGPRLALLALLGAAWSWLAFLVPAGLAGAVTLVADEYVLYAALPLLAACSAIAAALDRLSGADDSDAARGQKWVLRACLTAALGFAALHKLNTDFLNSSISCAGLARRLSEFWAVPPLDPGPWPVLLLEGLAAPLLWFYPRFGLLWTAVLAGGLGHIGPAAFNALIVAAAIAFVRDEDVDFLGGVLRRGRAWFVALALVLAPLSFGLYRGPIPWTIFAVFEAVLALAVALSATGMCAALRSGRFSVSPRLPRLRLPGGPRHRRLAALTLVGLCVLGLSPYLGLKYRYSFAMLSNLRVDDARWNSLIVPRQVRLRASDPFVHVLRVDPLIPRAKPNEPVLAPGVYSPGEFRRLFESARKQARRSALELRYRGRHRQSTDLSIDLGLMGFAAALPEEPLFQASLALNGPQRCVH
jgi:hypothetical protein